MKNKYFICHIDKIDIELRNEIIDQSQGLDIVLYYPLSRELKRMMEIDERKICYNPSLDFKNISDSHSFCLTAEPDPNDYSFSVWYNRPVMKKMFFGFLGEQERFEVIDKCYSKGAAVELLTNFLNEEYHTIEREMKKFNP